jgi:hypothetical protein
MKNVKKYPDILLNISTKILTFLPGKNVRIFLSCWLHYGFLYWFEKERLEGFLQEDSIVENKFPNAKIFEYPAFKSYLKEFYQDMLTYEITNGLGCDNCVKIIFPNKTCTYLDIPNYGFEIR